MWHFQKRESFQHAVGAADVKKIMEMVRRQSEVGAEEWEMPQMGRNERKDDRKYFSMRISGMVQYL